MSCIGVMYQPYNSYAASCSPGAVPAACLPAPPATSSQEMTSPQPAAAGVVSGQLQQAESPRAAASLHFNERNLKREICDKDVYKAAAAALTAAAVQQGDPIGPATEMDMSRLPVSGEAPYPAYPGGSGRHQDPGSHGRHQDPGSHGRHQEQFDSPRSDYPSPRESYSGASGSLERRDQPFPNHPTQSAEYPLIHPAYTRAKEGYRSPQELSEPGVGVGVGVGYHHHHSPETRTESRDGSCGPSSPAPPPAQPLTPHSPISHDESNVDPVESVEPVYLSRNIVVYTKFSGDPGSLVDMHFSKALAQQQNFTENKGPPMAARNLPPSFFNANYHHAKSCMSVSQADLYSDYSSLHHHLAAHASAQDPWQYAAQAGGSYHRSAVQSVHDLYSRNPAGYSALLNLNRMPAVKTESAGSEWYPNSSGGGDYLHHSALDRGGYSTPGAHHYTGIHTGLDGSVGGGATAGSSQEGKELYWPPF